MRWSQEVKHGLREGVRSSEGATGGHRSGLRRSEVVSEGLRRPEEVLMRSEGANYIIAGEMCFSRNHTTLKECFPSL